MKRINPKVEQLLKSDQKYRDSDKELLLAFWEGEGLSLNYSQRQAFMNCTIAESITRARRELKSKYPASKKVDDKRFELFQEYREEYSDGGVQWYRQ